MKTLKTSLSAILKSLLILGLIFNMSSCSGDDDNNNDDDTNGAITGVALPARLITTYTGFLSYTPSTGDEIESTNSTATISGSSSNYTISFSDGVPSISGITFVLVDGNYVYVNPEDDSEGVIINTTDNVGLSIGLTVDNNIIEFTA
ncbi:hypothetical protein [uncultured Algibacter sp.]|uniref:hypothetical protein n=1 Tax=uncultured Algibacter sp. TaxID=298659 RepID=UPI0032165A97